MSTRKHAVHEFNFTIYRVDESGDILEAMAHANNFKVALAAFEAAAQARSWSRLEMRNGARIVKTARTGGCDYASGIIERLA